MDEMNTKVRSSVHCSIWTIKVRKLPFSIFQYCIEEKPYKNPLFNNIYSVQAFLDFYGFDFRDFHFYAINSVNRGMPVCSQCLYVILGIYNFAYNTRMLLNEGQMIEG